MARERLLGLSEAVSGLVRDGDLLAMTAEMDAVPLELIREIVRQGKRDLRVAGLPGSGIAWDLLIGAGCVAQAEVCHCSLGPWGPAPNFKRYAEAGRLSIKDNT